MHFYSRYKHTKFIKEIHMFLKKDKKEWLVMSD